MGTGTASYEVAATSAAGLALTFDGVSITYNADDALQHLAAGEVFSDSFTYTVTDANGNTATATVTLSVTGQASDSGPVANDDRLGSAGGTSQPGYVAGDEFNIETGDARWNNLPSTAATGTGGAIVVWDAQGPASNEDQGIRCTILDAEGNVVVSEFQVSTPSDLGVLGMSAVVSYLPKWGFCCRLGNVARGRCRIRRPRLRGDGTGVQC
ncbi:Ig-like domain-containing protein [Pseudophaeobacter leonis]|uniref:Ig-like domain-containing protein n=1 Tax=Pseudophaeobacter leonis TaxID=1144477 RepID=UPI0009F5D819|nr:VCBS domain-containing protein [Pseudophaeobacter leonis]